MNINVICITHKANLYTKSTFNSLVYDFMNYNDTDCIIKDENEFYYLKNKKRWIYKKDIKLKTRNLF